MELWLLTVSAVLLIFFAVMVSFRALMADRLKADRMVRELSGVHSEIKPRKKEQGRRRNIKVSKVFSQELAAAGIRMRGEEFLALWLIAAVLPAGVMLLFGAHALSALAVMLIGLILPPLAVQSAKGKRLQKFEKQLGDVLLLIANCLRAGFSFLQAMTVISEQMQEPIGKEFMLAVREINMGVDMDTALDNMVERVRSTDLLMVVAAVKIQRRVGGNLLEVLVNISATIKERLRLKNDIRVLTAQGRVSALVIGLLPVFLSCVLMIINPAYLIKFVQKPAGIAMLAAGAVMEIIGFILVRRVVTIKY
ncbi:MAG: Bacterial type II secretion system protein F domain protein [Firmicutes bacterium ADurb.Bin182]|nr:MAG: Bacterial type II secretion system protein F domain protein [Firmicutes bacterium ADurb.Bin182]